MRANITFEQQNERMRLTLKFELFRPGGVPVEVHFVYLGVVVLDLGVRVADEDGEVGQAALQREHLGKAADVFADVVHQTLDV